MRAILLDIEGTTTPIDFVFKTLFPFASAQVEEFLRRHFREPEVGALIVALKENHAEHPDSQAPHWAVTSGEAVIGCAAAYTRWLISRDSKITALKTLQGKIWEEGFLRGLLRGELYPDVAPALARWKEQGRRMAIFSSGSVLAQKLLFAHSTAGDLSSFLEAYFDTTTGAKREPASYRKIAGSLRLAPGEILFVSDVGEELDAASSAGMKTVHSLRPGVAPLAVQIHAEVESFAELFPEE